MYVYEYEYSYVQVREFASNWRTGIQQINDNVLAYFANFRNGMEILKQVLSSILGIVRCVFFISFFLYLLTPTRILLLCTWWYWCDSCTYLDGGWSRTGSGASFSSGGIISIISSSSSSSSGSGSSSSNSGGSSSSSGGSGSISGVGSSNAVVVVVVVVAVAVDSSSKIGISNDGNCIREDDCRSDIELTVFFHNEHPELRLLLSRQVLTQLLLYYTRFQDIIKKSFPRPPMFTRDIVSTATIMMEIKRYNRTF